MTRESIFVRDSFTCVYCGRSPIEDGIRLQTDHVVPKSKGGESKAYNIVTSCEACNLSKGSRILSSNAKAKILTGIALRNEAMGVDHFEKVVKTVSKKKGTPSQEKESRWEEPIFPEIIHMPFYPVRPSDFEKYKLN